MPHWGSPVTNTATAQKSTHRLSIGIPVEEIERPAMHGRSDRSAARNHQQKQDDAEADPAKGVFDGNAGIEDPS